MNSQEENPERHVPFERWGVTLYTNMNKNNLYEENGCMHTLVPASVEEGVEVLKVPIKGHLITTDEVSVKWGINRNAQKSVFNEKTHRDACTNNIYSSGHA